MHRCLQPPGVLKVRKKRGPHFGQKVFQPFFPGIGDQRLVDNSEYLFVIGHFVIDICFVKCCTAQRLEFLHVLFSIRLQALADRIVLRSQFKPGCQLGCGLIGDPVVRHHALRKKLDFGVFRLELCSLPALISTTLASTKTAAICASLRASVCATAPNAEIIRMMMRASFFFMKTV